MRALCLVLAALVVAVHAQRYNDPLFVFESDGKPSKLKGRSCVRVCAQHDSVAWSDGP
jgi:hypothetical protein